MYGSTTTTNSVPKLRLYKVIIPKKKVFLCGIMMANPLSRLMALIQRYSYVPSNYVMTLLDKDLTHTSFFVILGSLIPQPLKRKMNSFIYLIPIIPEQELNISSLMNLLKKKTHGMV